MIVPSSPAAAISEQVGRPCILLEALLRRLNENHMQGTVAELNSFIVQSIVSSSERHSRRRAMQRDQCWKEQIGAS